MAFLKDVWGKVKEFFEPSEPTPESPAGRIAAREAVTPTKITDILPTPTGTDTYYWRARAKNPTGINVWDEWSATKSFVLTEVAGADFTKLQVNIADVWKTAVSMKINKGDVWKNIVSIKINKGDVWKDVL